MTRPGAMISIRRVSLTVLIVVAMAWVALKITLTQPTWGGWRAVRASDVRADAAALRASVEFLCTKTAPRNIHHPEVLERAAAWIARGFKGTSGRVALQSYAVGGERYHNVIARFGPDEGPLVVVGAHYDVCGDRPGADDNASGVAGLLELGRLLGTEPPSVPVELVAFTLEEPPAFGSPDMGSAVHAAELRRSGRRVRGMISLEMIGYYTDQQPWPSLLLRSLYPGKGNFIAVVGRWRDRALARRVKGAILGTTSMPACSYSGPVLLGADLSDHRNYWEQGWTAVMVTDTAYLRNGNYHTAQDTPSTLDYARMSVVVDGVFGYLRTLRAER